MEVTDHQPKMVKKPKCKLVGENGNIFNLMGVASKALKKAARGQAATEMSKRIMKEAKSYDEALAIIQEYVDAS